jgi:hypothetical protein
MMGVTCLAAGRATPGSAIATLLHSFATLRYSATLRALRIPNAGPEKIYNRFKVVVIFLLLENLSE